MSYHQQRLERTFCRVYEKSSVFNLQEVIKVPETLSSFLVKLRFLYNDQDFICEYDEYKPRNIKTLRLLENNIINYSFKSTDRSMINHLFEQKDDCDDILIVKNGFVTDSSSANIVFFNGKNWLTPDTPLLEGTCRARLLEKSKIKEAVIRLEQIPAFQSFCLINAMVEGFDHPLPINNIIF
ncbi:MAG: aminotransferase class IV [Candidatus Marinimicrobia bacterium]|nr:aminotransferase class IV [Candidatus Neomarinimicrobiota bacterium]